MILFFAIVDPLMMVNVWQPLGDVGNQRITHYWVLMPVMYGLIAVGVAVGSLLGDFGVWSREDYVGAILLIATPFLLVASGLLDIISTAFIHYFSGNGLLYGFTNALTWTGEWWWLDGFTFPWIVSRALGYQHTQGFPIFLIGMTIGLAITFLLWFLYWAWS